MGDEDRADGSAAARKINFLKRLHRLNIANENYGLRIAQIVATEHISDTLSLCIVNKVADAIEVMDCLANSGIPVKLLHSRFRGYERDRLCNDLATGVKLTKKAMAQVEAQIQRLTEFEREGEQLNLGKWFVDIFYHPEPQLE